ncbi:DUF2911 domain-containing protein [Taibaiella koreensis]|uniref:DUF2911 domain-containing protein n=1 Tax=Taibaiella koreensis TaxID=1268548 RepID=UPI000E59FC7B|nr:DUF2911 domain-containing protein [Taibaiella koreensis]
MKRIFITILTSGCLVFSTYAQDLKLPAPSPTATIKQDFSTSSIEINYSRPAMRGRKIFGDLVPYGQVWRTGANTATKVTFNEDVMLEGVPAQKGAEMPDFAPGKQYEVNRFAIPKGTYALYTVPGRNAWKIILNKGIGNWGVSGFDPKDDVAEFVVHTDKLADAVQSFTISLDNLTGNQCALVLSWENTKVTIPVVAENDQRITEYLEKSINEPKRPYQQAANYYLETGKNLDKALTYANKAIEENKEAFWLYWLKARIYQKMGNKKEAVTAAQKSATLAAATPYAAEYKRNADTIEKEMK